MAVVLVVDDSAVDRTRAGGLLKKGAGLVPIYASNGRDALAMIAAEKPDIVISDLQMPEMNGLELVEAIRREHPGLPVIVMTAHGSEETAIQALRKGATNYVAKRNLAKELVATVKSVLEIARTDRGQQQVLAADRGALRDRQRPARHPGAARSARDRRHPHAPLRSHGVDAHRGRPARGGGQRHLPRQPGADLAAARGRRVRVRSHWPSSVWREGAFAERRVHVTARETRNDVTYVIRDEGRGFDPTTLPDPTDPANLERSTGRGLFLIRTFMDEVRHNAIGNEITLVKRRDR